MGFGGGFKKAFKKAKKTVSKAAKTVSNPVKMAQNVVQKGVNIAKNPIGTVEAIGEGALKVAGGMGKAVEFIGDEVAGGIGNVVEKIGEGVEDFGDNAIDFGKNVLKGLKNIVDPPKQSKPEAPPKPDAPDLSNTWKEYSGWMDTAKQARDSSISMSRARLYEAGALPDVITAHETDLRSQYDTKVAGFQQGANFKMLQEAFDIARGAKENPYAQALAKYTEGQDLPQYFAANYASGSAEADPKEALYRARRAAAGGNLTPGKKAGPAPGGGGGAASPDLSTSPGANPWMAAG